MSNDETLESRIEKASNDTDSIRSDLSFLRKKIDNCIHLVERLLGSRNGNGNGMH